MNEATTLDQPAPRGIGGMRMGMKFHSGPPPSLGWWPTSLCELPITTFLRWWNGEYWSGPARESDTPLQAAHFAQEKSIFQNHEIQWAHRPDDWPERSRT